MTDIATIVKPDMDYDFASHFRGSRGSLPFFLAAVVRYAHLVERVALGEVWYATSDGGWPRCGVGRVIAVGMQKRRGNDGEHVVPSVLIDGWLGSSWVSFDNLTDITPEANTVTFWRISDMENRSRASRYTPSLVVDAGNGTWALA